MAASAPGRPSNGNRRQLRSSTYIIPKTGEATRRQFTLRPSKGIDDEEANEQTSLLGVKIPAQALSTTGLRALSVKQSKRTWAYLKSKDNFDVLRCVVAYDVATLFTFVPFMSNLVGGPHQGGKHVVATITTYFHGARSAGSMIEATVLAFAAVLYSTTLCYSSMAVAVFFNNVHALVLGHVVVLLLFIGGGFALVGWAKQSIQSPLINVACSLTCLASITVLTKEGTVQSGVFSDDKISQIQKMAVCAILISVFASAVKPTSASDKFHSTIDEVSSSYSVLLSSLTMAFLSGVPDDLETDEYKEAAQKHEGVFSTLQTALRESGFERCVLGREKRRILEHRLVNSLQRLAQAFGALRIGVNTQFELLDQFQQLKTGPSSTDNGANSGLSTPRRDSGDLQDAQSPEFSLRSKKLRSATRTAATSESTDVGTDSVGHSYASSAGTITITFDRFLGLLGPSMKSLTYCLSNTFNELPVRLDGNASPAQYKKSLLEALNLYRSARTKALESIYSRKELSKPRDFERTADWEEVGASCKFFSYTLQHFADETVELLSILEEIDQEKRHPGPRSWSWTYSWLRRDRFGEDDAISSRYDVTPADRSRLTDLEQHRDDDVRPDLFEGTGKRARSKGAEEKASLVARFRCRLWRATRVFRQDEVKFLIKVGLGAVAYAAPAFAQSTRPWFLRFRGEWGLLSYMLVIAQYQGAVNHVAFNRFGGTALGAFCAAGSWYISGGRAWVLLLLGSLMAYLGFYLIVVNGNGPMGRFIMLSYNLVSLYAYSVSVHDHPGGGDEVDAGGWPDINQIAWHRVSAVFSGVIWGLIVTRAIWPIRARTQILDSLSTAFLRLALIWRADPLGTIASKENKLHYMDMSEEIAVQQYMSKLETMQQAASAEFDLRGPFPEAQYDKIRKDTSSILDCIHSLNVEIMHNPVPSKGELDLLEWTDSERKELAGRLCHLFQVIASSFKLQYPLTDSLPSIEHARDAYLAKLFRYRTKEHPEAVDEDFAMYYAEVLVAGQIQKSISSIAHQQEEIFGQLSEKLLQL